MENGIFSNNNLKHMHTYINWCKIKKYIAINQHQYIRICFNYYIKTAKINRRY